MIRHGLAVQTLWRDFNTIGSISFNNFYTRLYSTRFRKYDKTLAKKKPNRKKIRMAILDQKARQSKSKSDKKLQSNSSPREKKEKNAKYESEKFSEARKLQATNHQKLRYDTLKVLISSNPQNRPTPKKLPQVSQSNSKDSFISQKGKSHYQEKKHHKKNGQEPERKQLNVASTKMERSEMNLTYDALQKYITKVCKNVILEEKLNTDPAKILTSKDFRLVWYEESGKQTRVYSLDILMTPEFLDKFLSKKLQKVGTMPICVGQTMMLMTDDKNAWYGTVTSAEIKHLEKEDYRNYAASKTPHNLKIDVQLFEFNRQSLPTRTNIDRIKILPASFPTSRLFTALAEIKKSNLRDIILGKKLIPTSSRVGVDISMAGKSKTVQSIMKNPVTIVPRTPNIDPVEANCKVIKELFDNGMRPIIVISASNTSLDSMCHKLLPDYENSILRIVAASKQKFYHKDNKVHSICLHNIVYNLVPTQIKSYMRRMSSPDTTLTWVQNKVLKNALIPHSDRVIAERDIIFTTPVIADGVSFRNYTRKPIVVVDDASQSSEATTLIPLLLRGFLRFVLLGDPHDSSSFSQVPEMSYSHLRSMLNGK